MSERLPHEKGFHVVGTNCIVMLGHYHGDLMDKDPAQVHGKP